MSQSVRLEHLERRCRLLTIVVGLLGIAVGTLLFGAARSGPLDEVRTKSLTIVNDEGRQVGTWVARKDGSGIDLWDGNGVSRVRFFAVSSSSGLYFHAPDGQSAFNLIERPENWGIKIFGGGKNEQGAALFGMPGEARFYLYAADKGPESDGQSRVFMSVRKRHTVVALDRGERSLAVESANAPFSLMQRTFGNDVDEREEVDIGSLIRKAKKPRRK